MQLKNADHSLKCRITNPFSSLFTIEIKWAIIKNISSFLVFFISIVKK